MVIATGDGTVENTGVTCDAPGPVEQDVTSAVCDEDGNVVVITTVDGIVETTDVVCDEDANGVTSAVCDENGNVVIATGDGTIETTGVTCDAPEPVEVCDAEGNVVADGEEGVDGASAANCGDEDPVTVEVQGTVECPAGSDRAGETIEPGESCDDDPDAGIAPAVCDADGNVVADGEEGADGASAANCGDDEEPVTVEVQGTTEEPAEGALAVTGVTSQIFILIGLIAAALGMWFAVAGAWFKPAGRRS